MQELIELIELIDARKAGGLGYATKGSGEGRYRRRVLVNDLGVYAEVQDMQGKRPRWERTPFRASLTHGEALGRALNGGLFDRDFPMVGK